MSGRRANANPNRIRGPQSALTDFLASHNISARQIRDSARERLQQTERNHAQDNVLAAINNQAGRAEQTDEPQTEVAESSRAGARKRKRGPDAAAQAKAATSVAKEKAAAKENKNKNKKKRKRNLSDDDDDDDDDDDYFNISAEMYKKSQPRPGQLGNCATCLKRFTVTAYSMDGPAGGLLCGPCGKKQKELDKRSNKNLKNPLIGRRRRQTESNRLDGFVSVGTKSLQQLCIEKVVKHHADVEEFGDLPDSLLHRLSEIFSKQRVLGPHTLPLFLRPDLEDVAVNDAANLDVDDYKQIFAVCQRLRSLTLRNACQFKDGVIDYALEKAPHLSHLTLHAANLISDEKWLQLFPALGHRLQTLKLSWLDASFNDDTVECIVDYCPNISRLKFKYCRRLTASSLAFIARLTKLEHLSLHFSTSPESEQLIQLINAIGSNLKTLSFENFVELDDRVIEAIAARCGKLRKLRLTNLDQVTDAALGGLFTSSSSLDGIPLAHTDSSDISKHDMKLSTVPPLRFVDLSSARDVDFTNPTGPVDTPIGLAASSFLALMRHSGQSLETLRIPSCRHVSLSAFLSAFPGSDSKPITYANLRELNVSFCSDVDTTVIAGVFACCPALQKAIAFGCFNVDDPVVPRNVALIGVPRAQDMIERVGGWTVPTATNYAGAILSDDGTKGFMKGLLAVAPIGA